MISPITKTLSKSILHSIKMDKVIYAEVTPAGAMGNSGGIIIYIPQSETNELICYETSIYDDEETYLMAEDVLYKFLDRDDTQNGNENLFFDYYHGGMGNNVLINKEVILAIQDNYFVWKIKNIEFQIFSSVEGVFNNVVRQLDKSKKE
jgi:hypothetical protein